MGRSDDQLFSIQVSADRLHAFIKCCKLGGYSEITPGQIVALLEASGIEVADQVTERIHEFAQRLKDRGPLSEDFEIATGIPTEEGADARFVWDCTYRDNLSERWHVQGKDDFYDLHSLVMVTAGQALGTLIPLVEGHDGTDVHGNCIPRERPAMDLAPGKGVSLAADGERLVAQNSGKVEIKDGKIEICDCKEIAGDVRSDGDKISVVDALRVSGAVCGGRIQCGASLTVDKNVEAAEIIAGNDVTVGDGICGRNRGRIEAGGDIVARYSEAATLVARKHVRILTSISQGYVHAAGKVDVAGGAIVGGVVYARDGVIARTIGSDAGVRAVIRVGIHPDTLVLLSQNDREIRDKLKAEERIRQTVDPLMAQLKRLTPAQREKATELFYKADDLKGDVERIRREQDKILQRTRPLRPPSVEVESRVHQGTTIYFDEYVCTIESELRGPLLIRLVELKGQRGIAAFNTFTNTRRALPTRKCSASELEAGRDGLPKIEQAVCIV